VREVSNEGEPGGCVVGAERDGGRICGLRIEGGCGKESRIGLVENDVVC
jgi:hypothetical protein